MLRLHVVPIWHLIGKIAHDGTQTLRVVCIGMTSQTDPALRFWHWASVMQLSAQRKLDAMITHKLFTGHADSPLQLAEQ